MLFLDDIASAGTISVHAITSSWNEASVSWNNQPPFEATPFASIGLSTSDEGSVISIDVTSAPQAARSVLCRWPVRTRETTQCYVRGAIRNPAKPLP